MSKDDIYDLRPLLRANAEASLEEGAEFTCAAPERVLLGVVMPPASHRLDSHPYEANSVFQTRAELDEYLHQLIDKGAKRAWARGYAKGWRIAAAKWSKVRDAIVIVVEAIE